MQKGTSRCRGWKERQVLLTWATLAGRAARPAAARPAARPPPASTCSKGMHPTCWQLGLEQPRACCADVAWHSDCHGTQREKSASARRGARTGAPPGAGDVGEAVVGRVRHELPARDHEHVHGHQAGAAPRRRALRNVHRHRHARQAHAQAHQHPPCTGKIQMSLTSELQPHCTSYRMQAAPGWLAQSCLCACQDAHIRNCRSAATLRAAFEGFSPIL